jgi:hypothetical protein
LPIVHTSNIVGIEKLAGHRGLRLIKENKSFHASGVIYTFEVDRTVSYGEVFTYDITTELLNTFTTAEEYWEQVQLHPTEFLIIRVIFPVARPPVSFYELIRAEEADEGARMPETGERPFLTAVLGRPSVEWHLSGPRDNMYYSLHWKW